MAKKLAFEDLPVGDCFAFSSDTRAPSRQKIDERHTRVMPGGKKPLRMYDVETPIYPRGCAVAFGRRKRKSSKKRSR